MQAKTPTIQAKLHKGQTKVSKSKAKVILVLAGTGGGKTKYAPIWVLEERRKLLEAGVMDPSGLVVAPYKILKRTTMPAFLNLFGRRLKMGAWESRQDGIWKFHEEYGGGYIYFASADTPESIEGAHVHWAVLDECGQRQFPEESFRATERRVRFYSGRILAITTPYVIGWLKALTDTWKEGKRPDVDVINFPSSMNPRFPKDEIERARKTLAPWQFRMFYLGLWDRPVGLIYSMIDEARHWINWSDLPNGWENWDGYAGLDFGFSNPHANLYGALNPDDVLYIFDEYYETGRTHSKNAEEAPHKVKVRQAWGDPSSPEAIAEFAAAGWSIQRCPSHAVSAGIQEVVNRLNTNRLVFVRGRIPETSREMDSYVWDDKVPDKVVKMFDHTMDSLRYMCWGLKSLTPKLLDQQRSPGRIGASKRGAGNSLAPDISEYSPESVRTGSRTKGYPLRHTRR